MQIENRHQVILEVIAAKSVGRQDELARLLTERGFSVTQASVSRDLEKLGVVKINGRYVRPSVALFGAFGAVSFAEAGDNLVVIKCSSGLASAAAVRIDAAGISEIVGTIAGDDTIFVAVKDAREQVKVIRSLRNILETSEGNGNN
jgi:transcriptional regulator of arginine metabolism